MQEAHVLKDHIADSRFYLDNYTTIGPSDQDSNLNFFLTSVNSVYIRFGKKSEEIQKKLDNIFIFIFLLLNFN